MIKNLKQTAVEWHPMLPVQPLKENGDGLT
jgi:hypothetical protein